MAIKLRAAIYARVSTLLGQDIEHQLFGIRALVEQREYSLYQIYSDEGISGRTEKRPALNQLILDARRGQFDILIVHSIDRLGRSTKHLLQLIDELKHYRVTLISVREGLDFTTPTGQMALTMLSAVAQLEAQLTSERIRTSMAVKKALAESTQNGWRCGRPPLPTSLEQEVLKLKAEGHSNRAIAKRLGNVSKSSVSRIIKSESQNGS